MNTSGSTAVENISKGHTLIGVISEIHGPVVIIDCDQLPMVRQALYTPINDELSLFEVRQHLDERRVRAITMHRSSGLSRGMPVYISIRYSQTAKV